MSIWGLPTLVALFAASASAPATVSARGHETLTPNEATQIGMVTAWQRSTSIPGGLNGIVDVKIHVDKSRPTTVHEVLADGKVLARVFEEKENRFGQPIGKEAAKREANMMVYKLRRRGIEAIVSERTVPKVRLYLAGKGGTIEAHDAETGRVLWSNRHGDERVPCSKMSINDDVVVFVNGADLYVLDALTGELMAQRHFTRVPLTAPVIVGDYVIAACTARAVEGYNLKDLSGDRFTAMVAGLPLAQPTRAPDGKRMMWPTDAGFVYAVSVDASDGKPRLEFRFPADGLVSSEIAATSGERFIVATEKGQVYGISALKNGSLMWRKSLGEPVYSSPKVIGERVLVQTVYGNLYCFNLRDGSLAWPAPVTQVEKILGGTDNQILVRTMTTHLEAIDAESGSVLMEFMATNIVDSVENPYTDRFYLMTTGGNIQCLRPSDSELPVMLMPDEPAESAVTPATEQQVQPEPLVPDNQGSPFGSGPATEADTGGDPFGGANPFGGGGNPFGGGDDPFGGG